MKRVIVKMHILKVRRKTEELNFNKAGKHEAPGKSAVGVHGPLH